MFQKLKIFLLYTLCIILLVGSIVLGLLLYLKNNEAVSLSNKNVELTTSLANAQQSLEGVNARALSLTAGDVKFSYPISWTPSTNVVLGEFNYDTQNGGKIISKYGYSFSKDSFSLSIEVILGPTGFIPTGAKNGEVSYVKLNDDLARVRKNDSTDWTYVTNLKCATSNDKTDPTFGADYCYVTSVGAKLGGATTVALSKAATDDILKEADQIVISAFSK